MSVKGLSLTSLSSSSSSSPYASRGSVLDIASQDLKDIRSSSVDDSETMQAASSAVRWRRIVDEDEDEDVDEDEDEDDDDDDDDNDDDYIAA